jgi:hypothetical protein
MHPNGPGLLDPVVADLNILLFLVLALDFSENFEDEDENDDEVDI